MLPVNIGLGFWLWYMVLVWKRDKKWLVAIISIGDIKTQHLSCDGKNEQAQNNGALQLGEILLFC